jgi:hypothetical protein
MAAYAATAATIAAASAAATLCLSTSATITYFFQEFSQLPKIYGSCPTSRDPTPLRYQTDSPEHRDPSPWRNTYVHPPSPKLWWPWDDWTPYKRWRYGKAMPEDDHLRLTDPDMFWPDKLIRDQFLTTEQRAVHREQMGIPPTPIRPQPQEGPSGSQPKCSGHDRRPVNCPDNVYGSQNPTQSEQVGDREFEELIEGVPAASDPPLDPKGKSKERADYLVKMVQEGGADLIKFLLSAAVSSADAKEKIHEVTKVCEWHFRDLMRLPKAA